MTIMKRTKRKLSSNTLSMWRNKNDDEKFNSDSDDSKNSYSRSNDNDKGLRSAQCTRAAVFL